MKYTLLHPCDVLVLYYCPFCQATSDYVDGKNVRVPYGCETYTIWDILNVNMLYNHLF